MSQSFEQPIGEDVEMSTSGLRSFGKNAVSFALTIASAIVGLMIVTKAMEVSGTDEQDVPFQT